MTTIAIYRNKRNKNKYIEVHNDGHYHNSVKQFMQWKKDHNGNQLAKPIRNEMGIEYCIDGKSKPDGATGRL